MDVQLIDENSRKPLAILFDVEDLRSCSLSKVRQMIVEQVSEVIPSNEFAFIHHGAVISRRQEHMLTVEKAALNSDDPTIRILPLSFCQDQMSTQTEHLDDKPNLIDCEHSSDSGHNTESSVMSTMAENQSTTTTKTAMLKLRSPLSAELQNLKIYSPAEIENGKGKEQEYRRFWNKTAKKLAKEKISNREIHKRVNNLWKLHRGKLLQMEMDELQETSKDICEEEQPNSLSDARPQRHKMKKNTLLRNIQRVREASSSVESLNGEVHMLEKNLKRCHGMDPSIMKETRENLKKAKICLNASQSELRKAQDTLRKNLGAKKSELAKYL